MIRLESGPATKDRNYFLIFFIFCLVMAALFFKDGTRWPGYGVAGGWIKGYVNKNREEARKKLTPLAVDRAVPAELGSRPYGDDFARMRSADPPPTREQFIEAWGEPFLSEPGPAGERTEHFVSDYGKATLITHDGQVDPQRMSWTVWYKDKDEVDAQYYWGLIPLAAGLYALYRVIRASTLRAVIDDTSMTYGGKRIAFADMTGFENYSPKGWVDLVYKENGAARKLRIDNYKIARFDEILDALCAATGFADPRPVKEEEEPAAPGESRPE